jgi:hypothetical protein
MERFEELQALWQSQPAAPGPPVGDLMRDLRGHSRKHQTIYIVKAVAVSVLAAIMLSAVHQSVVAMAGGLLLISGAALMLTVDWRANHAMARLEFTVPASSFAGEAIRMLRRLEQPLPVQYLALLFGPVAGLNLMEVAMLDGVSWQWRVAAHLGLSLLAAGAMWGGLHVRARRYRRETRPLIRRLETFQEESGG